MPLLPGQAFADRYVLQGRVRDGRLCREAPAIDALGDDPVLLWIPRARLLPDAAAQARFVAEATRLRRLGVPGTLPILDAGLDVEHVYVAVPDLRNSLLTLTPQLEQGNGSPGAALALARQLAPILDGLHAHDVVHGALCARDLLLLRGRIVVAGAGLWHLFERAALAEALADEPSLAPEVRAGSPVTPRADVYALAALCTQLAVGANARDLGLHAALMRHEPRLALALGPALAENPAARPSRCAHLLAALEDALAYQPRARGTQPPPMPPTIVLAPLVPALAPRRPPTIPPIASLSIATPAPPDDAPLDRDVDPADADTIREAVPLHPPRLP